MANQDHLKIIRQGSEVWNQWRSVNPVSMPDLSRAELVGVDFSGANLSRADLHETNLCGAGLRGADLRGANLSAAYLHEMDLSRADLRGADLSRADLSRAKLCGANLSVTNLSVANLSQADLRRADLSGANLSGADFSGANLSKANLSAASLSKANLTNAMLFYTIFGNANLTDALALDTCDHNGPSILDHSTLAQSGQLPLSFLRGCGLPDILIDYLPSLQNKAIQFDSCFISYSTKDQGFASRLHADLQNKGVRCWFAPHDIHGGKKVHEQIDRAIQVHDRLLLILSKDSMQSEWVKTEIAKARKREIEEKRRMLFPVRLVDFEVLQRWECFDADIGKDSAKEIREYYVPDFSNWKNHDFYQVEFEKLLRDLKTEKH